MAPSIVSPFSPVPFKGVRSGYPVRANPTHKFGGGASRLPAGKSISMFADGNTAQDLGISHANQNGLSFTDEDVTFETWVKSANFTLQSFQNLITKMNLVATTEWQFLVTSGSVLQATPSIASEAWNVTGVGYGPILDSDGWVHIAATRQRSNGHARFYRDGVLVASDLDGSGANDFSTGTQPVRIGRHSHPGTQNYKGLLADMRLWAVVRTADEIAENYNQTLFGTEEGLRAYWRFDDDFLDSSPFENHLTIQVAPLPTFEEDFPF